MGALIKRVCERWFVPVLVGAARSNVRHVAPTSLVGIDPGLGDRFRRPVSWRERPPLWAS
jgi:hypothetical protein